MHFIRRLAPKGLLTRFMLIIIIPTLIGQLLAIFLFYDRHWYNVSYYMSNVITNEISFLLSHYHKHDEKTQTLLTDYLNLSYQYKAKAVIPKKQPKLSEELEIFKDIVDSKIRQKKIISITKDKKVMVLLQVPDGVITVVFPSKLLMNPTTYIFVLWLLFLTATLLGVSLIFSKNQIRSILELTGAADAFGRGVKSSKRFKPSGATEIRNAGLAFIKMKNRIERQVSQRTQMLAMISHDLRTPLTRIKLQLELMDQSEEVLALKADTDSMQYMIDSYLDFARGEEGEQFQRICFSEWVLEFIKSQWNNLDITFDIKTKAYVKLKLLSFQRAISNLINNADQYSKKIKVLIYLADNAVVMDIEDDGPGITDKEKQLVFKPFYRSDKARSLKDASSNTGLGLAITQEIIKNHGGTISLEDSKQLGGVLVKIILPVA